MKTAQANMGLGDARSARRSPQLRLIVTSRKTGKRRTRLVTSQEWTENRTSYFARNVRFAAAAKAYRLVHDVTQVEVAESFGVSQSTVCTWESGRYGWRGGQDELNEYHDRIRRLAQAIKR